MSQGWAASSFAVVTAASYCDPGRTCASISILCWDMKLGLPHHGLGKGWWIVVVRALTFGLTRNKLKGHAEVRMFFGVSTLPLRRGTAPLALACEAFWLSSSLYAAYGKKDACCSIFDLRVTRQFSNYDICFKCWENVFSNQND